MKKNIILAVALAVICLNNLFAQENAKIHASVIQNFDKKFAGAVNVKWEAQPKGISFAQFRFENETWVAYYNTDGQLIAHGRMLKSIDTLPIKVKEALQSAKDKYQEKYGALTHSLVYEMTTDNDTEYYIPMANAQVSLLISLDDGGISTLRKRGKSNLTVTQGASAIARGN